MSQRVYPPDVESRPGYLRTGARCPWNVYRVTTGTRDTDERFGVVFDPDDGARVVAAMNAAMDEGGVLHLQEQVAEREATIQQLTDLVEELRRQLTGAHQALDRLSGKPKKDGHIE